MNGAEALACAYELAGVRVAYTFPITPQTEVLEYLSKSQKVRCIQADSEYNVLAGAEGVLWAGERCAVSTSSQGLVLMSELMWETAGNRLPLVMGVFNRALKWPAWNLQAQQNDSLFMRDTGWLQFYCESAQEILDFVLIAFRVSEEVLLPSMVAGDGFYVSHEKEEVHVPSEDEVREFVGKPNFGDLPSFENPRIYGGLPPSSTYFSLCRKMHREMESAAEVFRSAADEFAIRFGRRYEPIETIKIEVAETVMVTAGAISGTARQVVEDNGEYLGLLKIHNFRPFPKDEIRRALNGARKVAVFDRNIAMGIGGIFSWELKAALFDVEKRPVIYNFVTGLGGTDVTPEMVNMALDYMESTDQPEDECLFLTEEGVNLQ